MNKREKFLIKQLFFGEDAEEGEAVMTKSDSEQLSNLSFLEGKLSFLEENRTTFNFNEYSQHKFELTEQIKKIIDNPKYGLSE